MIGPRLRLARHTAELTLQQVGESIAIHWTTVARWERGEQAPPADRLAALCELYRVSADDVLDLPRRPRSRLALDS